MDLNNLETVAGGPLATRAASVDGLLGNTRRDLSATLGGVAESVRALNSVYDSIRQTEELMAAVRRYTEPLAGMTQAINSLNGMTASLYGSVPSLNQTLRDIHANCTASLAPWQSGLDGIRTLTSQFYDASIGISSIIEAQCAPWVRTAAVLSDTLTTHHMRVMGTAAAIHQAFQSWRTTFDWVEGLRGYAGWEPPSIAHFGPLCRYLSNQSWLVSCEVLLELNLDHYDWHLRDEREEIMVRLSDYYRSHLDEIETELAANYPGHGRQIASAFNSHRRGDFAGSIPCMFTIAEAIARARWQAPFFCFRRQRKIVMQRLGPLRNRSEQPYLIPLYYRGGLRRNSDLLQPTDFTLSRHAVDHGSRGDMDTETNSLRCIALLDYLHSLATDFQPMPSA